VLSDPPGLSIPRWRDRRITSGSGNLVQADSSLLQILATKQDIEDHFSTHGTGKITEIKLMNGFGFIEYEDAMDARDIVPGSVSYALTFWAALTHFAIAFRMMHTST
jgi:RNA recognition motif. (a.k.a. RRM, RBD, or RNP domain)